MLAGEGMAINNFGQWLRIYRKKRGFSVRQLAKYSGVSSAYISQIENGKRNAPSNYKILQKIAKPLKVELREIYDVAGYNIDNNKLPVIKEIKRITNTNISVQAAHKEVEIPVSEEDLEIIERFLRSARRRLKKEKGQ